MIQKYIKDIERYVEAIPYGEVNFRIERVNRNTVLVETVGKETLRYTDTQAAIGDIQKILENLNATSYSGVAHIECLYKDGQIVLVGIHDKKQTRYQK